MSDREATQAAMESRLTALLRGATDVTDARLDDLLSDLRKRAFRPGQRLNLLLFTASCLCARRAGRITAARMKALYRDEIANGITATPDGRMIDRHRRLLSRLVWAGCRRRGEIPAMASRKETDNPHV